MNPSTKKLEGSQEAIESYFMLKKIINETIDLVGYLTNDSRINRFTDILSSKLFDTTVIKSKSGNLILKFRDCDCKHSKDSHSNSKNRCLINKCKCKEYIPK